MGIFNMFPFTNFQEKNLDWFVNRIGAVDQKVDAQNSQIEAQNDRIDDIASDIVSLQNADTALSGRIDGVVSVNNQQNNQIAAINANIASLSGLFTMTNRKFIFVGDSYNAGWTPDGDNMGWGERCINYLGLTLGTNAWNVSYGGAGFGFANDNPMSIYYQVKAVGNSMSEATRNTITDIVIGCGRNDAGIENATINNGINATASYCKTAFPNARRWLFAIGWDGSYGTRLQLSQVYYECYSRTSANGGFIYNELFSLLQDRNYIASDYKHPTSDGNYLLGIAICQYLRGGSTSKTSGRMPFNMADDSATGYTFVNNYNVALTIRRTLTFAVPAGGISHTAFTELPSFTVNARHIFGATVTSTTAFALPAVLTTVVGGVYYFYDTVLAARFVRSSDNSSVYLALQHQAMNKEHTAPVLDSSITHIQIQPCTVNLPIQCA